jgi:hypothetical protein
MQDKPWYLVPFLCVSVGGMRRKTRRGVSRRSCVPGRDAMQIGPGSVAVQRAAAELSEPPWVFRPPPGTLRCSARQSERSTASPVLTRSCAKLKRRRCKILCGNHLRSRSGLRRLVRKPQSLRKPQSSRFQPLSYISSGRRLNWDMSQFSRQWPAGGFAQWQATNCTDWWRRLSAVRPFIRYRHGCFNLS